jgi:hypothetical protein
LYELPTTIRLSARAFNVENFFPALLDCKPLLIPHRDT